jgi:hypothetical protein
MSCVTSNSILQLRLKLLVKKATVCSVDLSPATAVYHAIPFALEATHCAWAGLSMPWHPHTALCFAGYLDNDITDFLSVSGPVPLHLHPQPSLMSLGTGNDACSTLLDGEIATIPVTRIFATVFFGLPVNKDIRAPESRKKE